MLSSKNQLLLCYFFALSLVATIGHSLPRSLVLHLSTLQTYILQWDVVKQNCPHVVSNLKTTIKMEK